MFRQTLLRVSLAGLFFNTLILNLNNVWIQAPRISGIQLLLSLLGNDKEKSQAIITEVFFLDRSRSSFPQKVDSTLLFLDKPKLKNPISPRISPTQTTSENIQLYMPFTFFAGPHSQSFPYSRLPDISRRPGSTKSGYI